uniref:HEPN domain-containing protein n=1 Tax=Haemonchus contortus TaxID=6289 RepID=A0A7I4YQ47_HAECO
MQQTRCNAVKAIIRYAREVLGELEVDHEGTERHGFETMKLSKCQAKEVGLQALTKDKSFRDLCVCRSFKKLAKAALAKTKKTEMDPLYERLLRRREVSLPTGESDSTSE